MKKLGIGCLVILLLPVVFVVIGYNTTPSNRPSAPSEPKASGPTQSTTSPGKPSDGVIPGLMPVDVYGNFDGKLGFDRVKREYMPDGSVIWSCKEQGDGRIERHVEISSPPHDATRVRRVRGTSLAYTTDPDETARSFLGMLATLPYEGAQPNEARRWVEQNIGQTMSTTIGGARFELRAGGRSRMLIMTPAAAVAGAKPDLSE